ISDRHIVMGAPEKGRIPEAYIRTQHVLGHHLALPLGYYPVLHSHRLPIGSALPSRDITGGIDAVSRGFKLCVHEDAAIDSESGGLGLRGSRPDTDTDDDEIRRQLRSILQGHHLPA